MGSWSRHEPVTYGTQNMIAICWIERFGKLMLCGDQNVIIWTTWAQMTLLTTWCTTGMSIIHGLGWLSRYSHSLWAGLPGIISRWGRRFLQPFRLVLGPTQPSVKWVPVLYPRDKTGGAWEWPSIPPRAEVKEKVEPHLYSLLGLHGLL